MKFPFSEPENTAVITCCHIIDNGADILYVSHDAEDGMWQFLCGGTHTQEQVLQLMTRKCTHSKCFMISL